VERAIRRRVHGFVPASPDCRAGPIAAIARRASARSGERAIGSGPAGGGERAAERGRGRLGCGARAARPRGSPTAGGRARCGCAGRPDQLAAAASELRARVVHRVLGPRPVPGRCRRRGAWRVARLGGVYHGRAARPARNPGAVVPGCWRARQLAAIGVRGPQPGRRARQRQRREEADASSPQPDRPWPGRCESRLASPDDANCRTWCC